jgi:hypothetical protein
VWTRSPRVRSSEREHTGEGGRWLPYHRGGGEGRGRSREGRRGRDSMERADAERVVRGDPG